MFLPKRVKPGLYEVFGKAHIITWKRDSDEKIYRVEFLIYLQKKQKVKFLELISDESDPRTQQVVLYLNREAKSGRGKKKIWKQYEFVATKKDNRCALLEFSIADIYTDPKPKVIYEDPIEVDEEDIGGGDGKKKN